MGPGVLSSASFDRTARPDCFWGFLVSMALPLRSRGLRHHELEQSALPTRSRFKRPRRIERGRTANGGQGSPPSESSTAQSNQVMPFRARCAWTSGIDPSRGCSNQRFSCLIWAIDSPIWRRFEAGFQTGTVWGLDIGDYFKCLNLNNLISRFDSCNPPLDA